MPQLQKHPRCQGQAAGGHMRAARPLLGRLWNSTAFIRTHSKEAAQLDTLRYATAAAAASVVSAVAAPGQPAASTSATPKRQTVDYTTLVACIEELRSSKWLPARIEQVLMPDKTSLWFRLRTLELGSGWLTVSWHPIAGRVCTSLQPPARGAASEGYSLAQLAQTLLGSKVLLRVDMPQAWERVVCLHFGTRPGEPPTHKLYCELMSRYSNIILTDASGTILACAYQVGGAMSSLRNLQAGRTYQPPPITQGVPPSTCSTLEAWQDTITRAAALSLAANTARKAQTRSLFNPHNTRNTQAATSHSTSGQEEAEGQNPNQHTNCVEATAVGSHSGNSVHPAVRGGLLVDGCVRAFHGISPALVQDWCYTAGILPSQEAATLPNTQWQQLWRSFQEWIIRMQAPSTEAFTPCSDLGLTRYSVLGTLPQTHSSVSALLDAYYSSIQASEQHLQLHQKLMSTVTTLLRKARNKVAVFRSQLADSSQAEAVQLKADMLTANLYKVQPGDGSVQVEDWNTGQLVTIQLDSTKPPAQVAEGLYRKARKLRRAVEAVGPLLEAAEQEVAYLEEVEEAVRQLKQYQGQADSSALQEVQDELVSQGYLKPPADAALAAKAAASAQKAAKRAGKAKKGAAKPGQAAAAAALVTGSGFRQFTSPGGYQVLVGRNNKQNDELSCGLAKPDDLWLHLRGRPGSHTLIRVPSGKGAPELGDEDVQFAANLAAYFSKGRSDLKCDVMVARAASVKKPKGAKPGQVMVLKELGNVVARPGDSIAAKQDLD